MKLLKKLVRPRKIYAASFVRYKKKKKKKKKKQQKIKIKSGKVIINIKTEIIHYCVMI